MLANILVQYFKAGGPVMWPILITAIVAIAVVGERTFWWWRESSRRDPATLEKLFAALEHGDFREASRLSRDSADPIIRMIWHGMNHFHSSLQGALQVAACLNLQNAARADSHGYAGDPRSSPRSAWNSLRHFQDFLAD